MKASEYIKHLEKLIEVHGDLEVYKYSYAGDTLPAQEPIIRQLASLKPRESKLRYLKSWDKDRTAIKDVIHI